MIEQAVDSLLRVAGMTSLVGQSLALQQLAQGSTYPAVVYQVVSSNAEQRLCNPPTTFMTRLQVNPIASEVAQVGDLHDLVRSLLETSAPIVVLGERIISCRFMAFGPWNKDDFTGLWTQPADYMLIHE